MRTQRPKLSDYLVENRQLAARLIAQSRDPQRVYREFRKARRIGRTSDQTIAELIHTLAELATERRWDENKEPAPLTPELKQRAAIMACRLMDGPAPTHVRQVTRNIYTLCDECDADIEYRTWLCEKCKAAKAA